MVILAYRSGTLNVTSRKGRVSRNGKWAAFIDAARSVTSRKGRVSRNDWEYESGERAVVTSRKGRVSRNEKYYRNIEFTVGHVPQGACE